ncbi:hypothetical protein [Bacillus sp. T33-2]|uniref:hypothetical protein n=1 Tax=Bacillus sp. T33-2 TaxID=2054168 RepID=UPI000C78D629|nr:hypothetical protein [Bacillus sp. T33-2]PLR94146.1 hypothetical protein CVD19_17850 [Bacillus sp. T33-2]
MKGWRIQILSNDGKREFKDFEGEPELKRYLMDMPVKTLLHATIYDPDLRSMDGRNYFFYYF